jgi:hypothetical protein
MLLNLVVPGPVVKHIVWSQSGRYDGDMNPSDSTPYCICGSFFEDFQTDQHDKLLIIL